MSALDGLIARVVEGQSAVRPIAPPIMVEPEVGEPWEGEQGVEEGAPVPTAATPRETLGAPEIAAAAMAERGAQASEAKASPGKAGREPSRSAPLPKTQPIRSNPPDPVREPGHLARPEPAPAGPIPEAGRPAILPLEPAEQRIPESALTSRDRNAAARKPSLPRVESPAASPVAPAAAVPIASQVPAAPDRVTIEIGRIEVASPAPSRARMLTLDDYRAARREGRR